MSEPNTTLPTFRLLDPPGLVAADRMNARMEARSAPLLRSIAGSAARFADRIFQSWFGGGERPSLFAAAGRSPVHALPYARPWYDDGRVWPARGITLRGSKAAPSPELVRGAAPPAFAEPRAIDLISSYVDGAEPSVQREAPNEAAPSARAASAPATAAPASIATRLLGRLTLADRIVRAASAILSRPQLEEGRSPIAASAAIAASDALVATESAPEGAPRRTAPDRVLLEPEPRVVTRTAANIASVPRESARSLTPAAVERAAMRVESALPASVPATWPRVQQFLEKLAGPVALAQAGVLAPLQRLTQRPPQPTARAASAPVPTWLAPEVVRGVIASAPSAPFEPSAAAAFTPRANEPAPFARSASTLVGEMLQRAPQNAVVEGERFAPGRAAQQAELLAQIAEDRGLRQFGYPEAVVSPSPRWSADAFTMVVPTLSVPAAQSAGPIAVGARHLLTTTPASPSVAEPIRGSLGERPVPGSIASIFAFVEAQLGARLETSTRPLPVRAPEVVYVDEDGLPATPAVRRPAERVLVRDAKPALAQDAEAARPAEQAVRLAEQAARPAEQAARPAEQAVRLAEQAARPAEAAPYLASVGLRSEQLAGEIGVRAAGLASEFLVEPHGEPVSPQTPFAQARAWLSTAEWTLLSVFPSNITAGEVAYAAAQRAGTTPSAWATRAASPSPRPRDESALPFVAPSAGAGLRTSVGRFASPPPGVAGAAPSMSLLSNRPAFALRALDASDASDDTSEPGPARDEARVARAQALTGNMVATTPDEPRRASLLHRLPDGRRPRGNRIIGGRAPTPVFASALSPSSALAAGSEASERRVESPVGPPLWGHLRPLVSDDGAARSTPPSRGEPAAEPGRSSPRQSAVLELLTPFVEAARGGESGTTAASIATAATAAASGARATSSSPNMPPLADRLSLADLALISIVSADQQVAAAGHELTAGALKNAGHGAATNKSKATHHKADDEDVDDIAEEALQRIYKLLRVKADGYGELGDT